MPILTDSSLDQFNINLGDCSFPDGNGQHSYCISEMNRRRQQKMKKSEKNIGRGDLTEKSVKKWVETKIYGLKIGVILACWTY